MAERPIQRRLAAILAADVVGYSGLMEQDEAGTLAVLRTRRKQILEPLVSTNHGRIFKLIGDGVLIEFGSAVDAVQCAIQLQAAMAAANDELPADRRIALRVGINIGDVIVEGGDLYGDGVNIAARLESLAEPGGICVSHGVYEHVRRKLDCEFDDLGLQSVRSLAEPIHAHRVRQRSVPISAGDRPADQPLPLPAKHSIAVLPFTNLSHDPEQESFADGLTEDLITELSRHTGLFVIARHSSFAYKGKLLDARRIAGDLGVRYLLEGSARRSAGRVRVNVQLIDAVGGNHLWAERFDRSLEDIFAVQDEVTAKIVEALVGRLTAPPPRNRPKSMDAYDFCVRGRVLIADAAGTPQAVREASVLCRHAIALDPDYAEAHRWLAFNHWAAWSVCNEPEEPNRDLSLELADRAVALDPNDAGGRWVRGLVLGYERRWSESDQEFSAALELDPNQADAWAIRADLATLKGDPKTAIEHVERALRLNLHPAGWYYWELGLAQYAARQYDAAIKTLRKEATYRTGSRRVLAASLAQLGLTEEARREAELFMASNPFFSIGRWVKTQPFHDEATRVHIVEGYRKAGLPD